VICATVTSLSPFALMEEESTTGTNDGIPLAFGVQAAPNPFSRRAAIGFDLPRAGTVRLEVYDLAGRAVRTLADGFYPAGRHAVEWDGSGAGGRRLQAGVYLCRLHAAGFTTTRRVVLMP